MESVAKKVAREGYRPPLPARWPKEITSLLERCWHGDPSKRPEFDDIAKELSVLLKAVDLAAERGEASATLQALDPQLFGGCCLVS